MRQRQKNRERWQEKNDMMLVIGVFNSGLASGDTGQARTVPRRTGLERCMFEFERWAPIS